jgi:NADPH:quinone reductase
MTDPGADPRLTLREAALPEPTPSQALVRVEAFSLNPGETRRALDATTSYVPGWDFAGVVERTAADGSSPAAGTRVFGVVPQGSWAEYVATRGGLLAEVPDGMTSTQAAALPVAGVTAMVCLEQAGSLVGRRVLITGAAGGVGRFACQLAGIAGAKVFAVSRRQGLLRQLREDGIEPSGMYANMAEAKAAGEYDVILDSVGGDTLGVALTALAANGVCVSCGNSSQQPTTFDIRDFYFKSNTRLHGVWLGRELAGDCRPMLTRLAELVTKGSLRIPICGELPWTRVIDAAEQLTQQKVDGKIVLSVA